MSFLHQTYTKIIGAHLISLGHVILTSNFYQNDNCSCDITLVYQFDAILALL
jgi:hypothetical protein